MPELPEVQTIVTDLNGKVIGDKIIDFWSDWGKTIKNMPVNKFKDEIRSRKILKARRIGKNIFIDLSGGKTIYIHLKMTGHLLVKNKKVKKKKDEDNYFDEKVNRYIHHVFRLGKNKTLEFSDMRKFAKIVLDDTEKINNLPEIRKLGIDAMSRDFTFDKFMEILLRRKNKPIGLILMEQEMIAGIGNIYRSEILFDAGVKPGKKANTIREKEAKKIYNSISRILKKAIRLRGTSDRDYRDTSGAPGRFQKTLKVYRREGQKCQKCATIITKAIMGQRSVFICPQCQK